MLGEDRVKYEAKKRRIEKYGREFGKEGFIHMSELLTYAVSEDCNDRFMAMLSIIKIFEHHKIKMPDYLMKEDLEYCFILAYVISFAESRGLKGLHELIDYKP